MRSEIILPLITLLIGWLLGLFGPWLSELVMRVVLIREDAALKGNVLNGRDDPPMLYADEVEELEADDAGENVDTGFSWYTDGEA